MDYYFSTIVRSDFDTAIVQVTKALNSEGFGVVTTLNLQEKFREKLGKDFKKYTILGACNPDSAYKAIQAEEKVGVMLPCNVLVIEQEKGMVEIAAVNPVASMQAIENMELDKLAEHITEKLKRVIGSL